MSARSSGARVRELLDELPMDAAAIRRRVVAAMHSLDTADATGVIGLTRVGARVQRRSRPREASRPQRQTGLRKHYTLQKIVAWRRIIRCVGAVSSKTGCPSTTVSGCAAVLLAMLVACDVPGVVLYVDLRTDVVPGVEFAVIETRVDDVGILRESAAVHADDFVTGRRVAEIAGLAPTGARRLTVRLLDPSRREIARRTLVVDHRADRSILVLVTRSCREVACPEGESCFAGRCQPETCGVDRTTCSGECASSADCGASSCATSSCETGACFYTPVAGACPAGTYCDAAEGCRPEPGVELDAGTDAGIDAGSDAGSDAGPPLPPFVLHSLPRDATGWSVVETLGPAPDEAVIAAFAPEGSGEIIALTDGSVHVLRLADLRWIERLDRALVFPELAGVGVWEAGAVSGTSPPLVSVYAGDGVWAYDWLGRTARFLRHTPRADFGADWSDPQAAPWWTVHGLFSSPGNAEGWVSIDPSSECPGHSRVGRYIAFISTDGFGPATMVVSIYDVDCPFRFVDQREYSTFPPFSLPGAPAPFSMEAIARPDGLFAFTRR